MLGISFFVNFWKDHIIPLNKQASKRLDFLGGLQNFFTPFTLCVGKSFAVGMSVDHITGEDPFTKHPLKERNLKPFVLSALLRSLMLSHLSLAVELIHHTPFTLAITTMNIHRWRGKGGHLTLLHLKEN